MKYAFFYLKQSAFVGMKVLGIVFIGLTVLLFLLFLIFAPDAPMTSDYEFTYSWPYILLLFGLGAGIALLLADWNFKRQKKGKVKH